MTESSAGSSSPIRLPLCDALEAKLTQAESASTKLLFVFGTPVEIVRLFGGKDQYEQAVRDLEAALYSVAG